MPGFVFSKQTCHVNWKGTAVSLEQGAAWHADDPFVKARPEFFDVEPPVVHGTRTPPAKRPVEDASADPDKKRSTK